MGLKKVPFDPNLVPKPPAPPKFTFHQILSLSKAVLHGGYAYKKVEKLLSRYSKGKRRKISKKYFAEREFYYLHWISILAELISQMCFVLKDKSLKELIPMSNPELSALRDLRGSIRHIRDYEDWRKCEYETQKIGMYKLDETWKTVEKYIYSYVLSSGDWLLIDLFLEDMKCFDLVIPKGIKISSWQKIEWTVIKNYADADKGINKR